MYFSKIIGTGSYLPDKVVTNFDLEKTIDTSDEWIYSRTGIRERRIAADNQYTSDLAVNAAQMALSSANIEIDKIDLIIVATTTPDLVFPSTACIVQSRLGGKGSIAFDVQAVCAGFVYALDVADKFIRCNSAKYALVIGAETFSRIIDWQDRNTCILFGDGAGAVVLEYAEQPGIISSVLHADGDYADILCVPSGVSKNYELLKSAKAYTTMQGSEVFKVAVKKLGESIDEILTINGIDHSDIDWLVPHQANIRIINSMAKKLHLNMDKVVVTIDKHGNTSAASIPLALDEAIRSEKIKTGHKVIMEGFGGGFAWGANLVQF